MLIEQDHLNWDYVLKMIVLEMKPYEKKWKGIFKRVGVSKNNIYEFMSIASSFLLFVFF